MSENTFEKAASMVHQVDQDGMQRITELAEQQIDLEQQIKDKLAEVDELKLTLRSIQEEELPSVMQEYNMKGYELESGFKIKRETNIEAHISKKNEDEAFAWLKANRFDDIIKNQIVANFGRGDESKAEELVGELSSKGYACGVKKSVHHNTLKSFCREQIEKGVKFPADLFGIFIGEKTKITKPTK